MIEAIRASYRDLHSVSVEAAEVYAHSTDKLLCHVNDQLEAHPKISELIGQNPHALMRDNHRKHATLMSTVFKINSFELLVQSVPWMFRAYHARGFSYDYFFVELVAWQIAVHECLGQQVQKAEILAVYTWLAQHHENMILLSRSGVDSANSVQLKADEMQRSFLLLFMSGDSQSCFSFIDQSIYTPDDVKHFYLDVVWPVMCRIGHMWVSNQISVAEEHLATAIVSNIMGSLYRRFAPFPVTRGQAVVSAGPNELHEIGARMVADLMEMDGWDVTYVGANTQDSELLDILKQQKPFVLALSVATIFNLQKVRSLLNRINIDPETVGIKTIVGGSAFSGMPLLWQEIGADGYAADVGSAIQVCNTWWMELKG